MLSTKCSCKSEINGSFSHEISIFRVFDLQLYNLVQVLALMQYFLATLESPVSEESNDFQ